MVDKIGEFRLYIFAFDDTCYDILTKENLKNVVVIKLSDFETDEMKNVKQQRTATEYCWTCTPLTIKYVLEHFNEKICTYIDADMMFFSNPQRVFDIMDKNNKSIIIVPHRYNSKRQEKKEGERTGYYCVEFNTFKNDDNGNKALNWWAKSCLEWCYYTLPKKNRWYGDQKYLNCFPTKFEGVFICNDIGFGLAPWNDKHAKLSLDKENTVNCKNKEAQIVFYHLAGVKYINEDIIVVSSRTKDKNLHKYIFDEYIKKVLFERKYIFEKYGFEISKSKRPLTKNRLINLYQKKIMIFKHKLRKNNVYYTNKIHSR